MSGRDDWMADRTGVVESGCWLPSVAWGQKQLHLDQTQPAWRQPKPGTVTGRLGGGPVGSGFPFEDQLQPHDSETAPCADSRLCKVKPPGQAGDSAAQPGKTSSRQQIEAGTGAVSGTPAPTGSSDNQSTHPTDNPGVMEPKGPGQKRPLKVGPIKRLFKTTKTNLASLGSRRPFEGPSKGL